MREARRQAEHSISGVLNPSAPLLDDEEDDDDWELQMLNDSDEEDDMSGSEYCGSVVETESEWDPTEYWSDATEEEEPISNQDSPQQESPGVDGDSLLEEDSTSVLPQKRPRADSMDSMYLSESEVHHGFNPSVSPEPTLPTVDHSRDRTSPISPPPERAISNSRTTDLQEDDDDMNDGEVTISAELNQDTRCPSENPSFSGVGQVGDELPSRSQTGQPEAPSSDADMFTPSRSSSNPTLIGTSESPTGPVAPHGAKTGTITVKTEENSSAVSELSDMALIAPGAFNEAQRELHDLRRKLKRVEEELGQRETERKLLTKLRDTSRAYHRSVKKVKLEEGAEAEKPVNDQALENRLRVCEGRIRGIKKEASKLKEEITQYEGVKSMYAAYLPQDVEAKVEVKEEGIPEDDMVIDLTEDD
ncbi:hypothetical protein CC2G_007913 [Coprinopsis cinerea AmutBmut pab1-1]|nr:hypothetical protein CC2G_007913 [Coprinopsis cinerea AmutBmut pab1-1]